MTKLSVIDTTIQKTNEWLRDIKEGLGTDNDRAAYVGLCAVLHGLRDLLGTDQAAQFGAQLPMLVRGIYYERWDPASTLTGPRRHDFLAAVGDEMRDYVELRDAERTARAVFGVIALHVAPGEIDKLKHSLPREVRALWPGPSSESGNGQ
jgi:uncharacterized protein (DUF2267 family)